MLRKGQRLLLPGVHEDREFVVHIGMLAEVVLQGNGVAVVGLEHGPITGAGDFLNVDVYLPLYGIQVHGGVDVQIEGVVNLEEHADVGGQQGSDGPLDGEEGVAGLGLDGEVDDLVEVLGASPHEGAGLAGEGQDQVAGKVGFPDEALLPGVESGPGGGASGCHLLEEGEGHELPGHLVHGHPHAEWGGEEEVGEVHGLAHLSLKLLECGSSGGVWAEELDGPVGVEVEALIEGGEQGRVTRAEGCHSELDLGQVEGEDGAPIESRLDAGFDLGWEGLGGRVLAGDASLDGATFGTRGILGSGGHWVPHGVGDAVCLPGVGKGQDGGGFVFGLVALALKQGPDVGGEHLLGPLVGGGCVEHGDLLLVRGQEIGPNEVAVGVGEGEGLGLLGELGKGVGEDVDVAGGKLVDT